MKDKSQPPVIRLLRNASMDLLRVGAARGAGRIAEAGLVCLAPEQAITCVTEV